MKTYILNTLNRYKQFSENSDVKAVLCNKSWRLFNDSGEQELYIFQDNETMFYSVNGQVTNGTWQYISANQSLIITVQNQSYMLHPAFIDTAILALQLDGTHKYLFMIDEKDSYSYRLKTLNDIENYFTEKERKIEENRKQLQQQEEARRRKERSQAEVRFREEQYKIEKERLKKEASIEWNKNKKSIYKMKRSAYNRHKPSILTFLSFIIVMLVEFLTFYSLIKWQESSSYLYEYKRNESIKEIITTIMFFLPIIAPCTTAWYFGKEEENYLKYLEEEFIEDYIKRHSNQ